MDDMQHETRGPRESSPAETDDREATPTALGQGRLLANPRRVRRA